MTQGYIPYVIVHEVHDDRIGRIEVIGPFVTLYLAQQYVLEHRELDTPRIRPLTSQFA